MKKALRGAAAVMIGLFVVLEIAGVAVEILAYSKPRAEKAAAGEKEKTPAELDRRVRFLRGRLAAYEPYGIYIVVDTAANRLTLRKGTTVVRDVVVSCGSGDVLDEPGGTGPKLRLVMPPLLRLAGSNPTPDTVTLPPPPGDAE